MTQLDEREQKLARRWSALANGLNANVAMLEDMRESIQDALKIIQEQREKIKQLEKALDEASKLAKIDKPSVARVEEKK